MVLLPAPAGPSTAMMSLRGWESEDTAKISYTDNVGRTFLSADFGLSG